LSQPCTEFTTSLPALLLVNLGHARLPDFYLHVNADQQRDLTVVSQGSEQDSLDCHLFANTLQVQPSSLAASSSSRLSHDWWQDSAAFLDHA
jgi:hypothetical protein